MIQTLYLSATWTRKPISSQRKVVELKGPTESQATTADNANSKKSVELETGWSS